jgi:hypothetical protein
VGKDQDHVGVGSWEARRARPKINMQTDVGVHDFVGETCLTSSDPGIVST